MRLLIASIMLLSFSSYADSAARKLNYDSNDSCTQLLSPQQILNTISASEIHAHLIQVMGVPPDAPKSPVDEHLARLAELGPAFAYRKVQEYGILLDRDALADLEEGKYVFAIVDVPHLNRREMRIGRQRFAIKENAYGHPEVTMGFKSWAAGELIVKKITQTQHGPVFDLIVTARSGTFLPENERLIHAVDWIIQKAIPFGSLELADYDQNTLTVIKPEILH